MGPKVLRGRSSTHCGYQDFPLKINLTVFSKHSELALKALTALRPVLLLELPVSLPSPPMSGERFKANPVHIETSRLFFFEHSSYL